MPIFAEYLFVPLTPSVSGVFNRSGVIFSINTTGSVQHEPYLQIRKFELNLVCPASANRNSETLKIHKFTTVSATVYLGSESSFWNLVPAQYLYDGLEIYYLVEFNVAGRNRSYFGQSNLTTMKFFELFGVSY
jgi:hypothetical protein